MHVAVPDNGGNGWQQHFFLEHGGLPAVRLKAVRAVTGQEREAEMWRQQVVGCLVSLSSSLAVRAVSRSPEVHRNPLNSRPQPEAVPHGSVLRRDPNPARPRLCLATESQLGASPALGMIWSSCKAVMRNRDVDFRIWCLWGFSYASCPSCASFCLLLTGLSPVELLGVTAAPPAARGSLG